MKKIQKKYIKPKIKEKKIKTSFFISNRSQSIDLLASFTVFGYDWGGGGGGGGGT